MIYSDETLYEIYKDGYDAGLEYHLGSGRYKQCPSEYTPEEEMAWNEGFGQAGEDI